RFPIGDRRGTPMRERQQAPGNARPSLDKRDSSGGAPASPQVAYRALLERAGSRKPADRGGVDGIGPPHIGLRLACSKALERFLTLVGRHLARATELDTTGLRTDSAASLGPRSHICIGSRAVIRPPCSLSSRRCAPVLLAGSTPRLVLCAVLRQD